jgi:glycosyltransferase involved in cell wall biosynthesis
MPSVVERTDGAVTPREPPAPVLFVHHAGTNWIRGSTRCLLDLLTHIDRARFRPVVWCNQPVILDAVAALGVATHRARDWESGHPLRPDARWIAETDDLIRRYGVRVVHADEFTQASVLIRATRRARIPLVAQLHQVPTPDERLWSLLHQVDLAVGTTRACVTGLLDDGFPEARTAVIYNGVDPARLSAGEARSLRRDLGISPDGVVVTLVGSLIHRKAVDVALRAWEGLPAGAVECHLLVCGSGPEREALEELAASLGITRRVHFLGERADAGAVLRDATDILLATSRDESFGLTLAEAGVFSLPVVASRIPAHAEVIADEAGVLVPPEDAGSFAAAIGRLAADRALRRRLGEAGRRRVESMFLIERYVRDYEAVYARMIAAPPATYSWRRAARWPRAYNAWIREAAGRRLRPGSRPRLTPPVGPGARAEADA